MSLVSIKGFQFLLHGDVHRTVAAFLPPSAADWVAFCIVAAWEKTILSPLALIWHEPNRIIRTFALMDLSYLKLLLL
jgi:hypothetical protein